MIGWSGDLFQLAYENGGGFGFAVPESGGTLWSDNLMVPIGSPHKTNAEKLINFYYDPAIAAEVAAYVNYICPVKGAQEAIGEAAGRRRGAGREPVHLPDRRGPGQGARRSLHWTTPPSASSPPQFQKVLGV